VADNGLAEALAAIGRAVDEARTAAMAAIDSPVVEESLAPVRKGARIIREIAWRWREIGADSRICDLLDSQVNAIEGACEQIASNAPLGELSAAFDLIEARIAEFGDSEAAAQPAAEVAPAPSPASPNEIAAAQMTAAAENADVATVSPAASSQLEVATAETVELAVEAAASVEDTEAMVGGDDVSAEAADAFDESVLDLIALEMAAPDPSDLDDIPDTEADQLHAAELPPAEPVTLAQQPEPTVAPATPEAIQPSLQPPPAPAVQPSLGSSLIASGIVRRAKTSESDPLAPIRRMSQAEKIAFFS
jgi:hypothetical protein